MRTSTHGQWKKEVQEESEDVVFDAWRKHLQREGWCVGQWRRVKIYVTKLVKDHNNDAKREGDLLRCGESQNNPGHAQWNIFFLSLIHI